MTRGRAEGAWAGVLAGDQAGDLDHQAPDERWGAGERLGGTSTAVPQLVADQVAVEGQELPRILSM